MVIAFRQPASLFLMVLSLLAARPASAGDEPVESLGKIYGEWRIAVKPDKGPEYDKLIETEGLPLFQKAGGRMVGWWKTLVGNLYEHVTIWEYDDMAAFERAIGILGNEKKFAEFVTKRDPLLSGEENRFLRLVPGAKPPPLPETAKFVFHETHRIPLARQAAYFHWLKTQGLPTLEKFGFRPAGPWSTSIGDWSEVTLLLRFESLADRNRLMARFHASPEVRPFKTAVAESTEQVTTRLLVPAPFAKAVSAEPGKEAAQSPILPHLERIAPRIFAAGFADKFRSANCGFIASKDGAVLIDLPRGLPAVEFCEEVERLTGRRPSRLILTHAAAEDLPVLTELVAAGVREIVASPATSRALLAKADDGAPLPVRACEAPTEVGSADLPIQFRPLDGTAAPAAAVVALPSEGVLFAGPLVVNGPRARLVGSDTAAWVASLQALSQYPFARIIPGFGSWTIRDPPARQLRFLEELRSQVAYAISLGKPPESLEKHVRISPDFQVWMPYDNPVAEDLLYVYRELTVPNAPFAGRTPAADDAKVHALVLIGDGPHEPQHLERGLTPAFAAAGITPHFTVDVRSLAPENLARVKLLVVLRDGLMRPTDDPKSNYCWVTREHEQAVVDFVDRGGGFLNLHNALGLYPDNGPYLKLAAGRYIGHGPLERFRVEAIDPDHPITRGISPFTVADEQHTPIVDHPRVRLLLRSRSDGGVLGDAGWVCEPGAGRLCHLACGHTREALLHPTYQQLLRNAMLWCVRRDRP